jgi:antitoxin component YwqK of YwqJK toxin-antitoxin module
MNAEYLAIMLILFTPQFGMTGEREPLSKSIETPSELVALLGNPDSGRRAAAAAELRQLIAANPDAKTNNHGEEYWRKLVDSVKVGMKYSDFIKLLPDSAHGIMENYSGRSGVGQWRLDHYWIASIYYKNPDIVFESPKLDERAMEVWVKPPEDFTGTWVTWHVNGQKSYEREFRNGMLNGLSLIFYDNGSKLHQQYYIDSVPSDTAFFWYPDGRKKSQGDYTNRKRTGTWIFWDADGSVDTVEYKD